ncbi:nucleotidyl transferase AbiEii/AbiGii toxin family protein [Dyadobacter sp. LJ53]|uniref:nucleotidyl transferase AbiEii/AbiGii toxin family protein n=1 Tax=Dyadobacter chenwenxiniae TaxID=2906456 RepID=UPI001F1AACDE|nr:nucleotidyl transferase AbiEii/AbiGii toxin family protein [Dyadobacter chenwenxiniae]MCF0051208.1 nucleotidyl transferase AbiEii/AbiGii toxin family protein [Dyadobacter chenwenxiniae]
MLHKDPFVIHPDTFKLIQHIQAIPELKNFYLVGGTSLALQIGHRNSIDIDLFTNIPFETNELIELLRESFKVEVSYQKSTNNLFTFIDNIKTDFIRHDYELIKQPQKEEGITFLGMEDIAAMKVNAIINSGKRLKDFVDIYFLLEHFSLNEIISFFEKKYPHMNPLIALKSLSYFNDIDPEMDPPKLKVKLPFSKIQQRIEQAIISGNKLFP